MRMRMLHPKFFRDGELYDAEQAHGLPLRSAFSGLWCYADREGRFEWNPREMKPDILPYDPVDMCDVLEALACAGFIIHYSVDGKEYGAIPNFGKYQRPHRREVASTIPAPDAEHIEPVAPKPKERRVSPRRARKSPGVAGESSGKDVPRTVLERAEDGPRLPESESESESESVTESTTLAPNGAVPHLNGRLRGASRAPPLDPNEQAVIAHYRERHPKRMRGDVPGNIVRLLRNALRSYTVEELKQAIDRNAASKFHREGNFMGLDLILRDSNKIDYFIGLTESVPDDGLTDEPALRWV